VAADPFAPPADPVRRPRAARRPAESAADADPYAAAPPAPPAEPREAAHAGTFWVVAAVGIGLLCLAQLIGLFTYMGDLDGEDVAPALFGTFGEIALAVGLALAALLQRGLSTPVRAALMLGAGYFASSGGSLGLLAAMMRSPFF
jgi:hypothetical protein